MCTLRFSSAPNSDRSIKTPGSQPEEHWIVIIVYLSALFKSFQIFLPQKECATMLTQVWQCGQPWSKVRKERNLRRQFQDLYWFHWHKLLHSRLSKLHSQSGIRGIYSRERAWSSRCIFQTSSICSSTEMSQAGGQAVILAGFSPARVNKLNRMKMGKVTCRYKYSILTHWIISAQSHWTKQITWSGVFVFGWRETGNLKL